MPRRNSRSGPSSWASARRCASDIRSMKRGSSESPSSPSTIRSGIEGSRSSSPRSTSNPAPGATRTATRRARSPSITSIAQKSAISGTRTSQIASASPPASRRLRRPSPPRRGSQSGAGPPLPRISRTTSQPQSAASATASTDMTIKSICLPARTVVATAPQVHTACKTKAAARIARRYGEPRSARAEARGTVPASPPVQALKLYQDGFASRSLGQQPGRVAELAGARRVGPGEPPDAADVPAHAGFPPASRRRVRARAPGPRGPRSQRDSNPSEPQPISVT